jgi:hypothetical protein
LGGVEGKGDGQAARGCRKEVVPPGWSTHLDGTAFGCLELESQREFVGPAVVGEELVTKKGEVVPDEVACSGLEHESAWEIRPKSAEGLSHEVGVVIDGVVEAIVQAHEFQTGSGSGKERDGSGQFDLEFVVCGEVDEGDIAILQEQTPAPTDVFQNGVVGVSEEFDKEGVGEGVILVKGAADLAEPVGFAGIIEVATTEQEAALHVAKLGVCSGSQTESGEKGNERFFHGLLKSRF